MTNGVQEILYSSFARGDIALGLQLQLGGELGGGGDAEPSSSVLWLTAERDYPAPFVPGAEFESE